MKLTQFLEVLTLYSYNMKVIHWNSIGKQFDDIHELGDKYHGMINGTIDTIAEMIGMTEENIPSFSELVKSLDKSDKDYIVVGGDEKYTIESGVKLIDTMLKDIVEILNSILEDLEKSETNMAGIRSEIETIQFEYKKEYSYFNKRRTQ